MPAPEEKNGARDGARPGGGFCRLERQADSQAELPLIELGAFDFHEAPAGKVAIGVVEMW